MRVKRGVATKKRHKKVISQAKGYKWGRKNVFSLAKNATNKAGQHAYVGRRQKKRDFRSLWIARISAAVRLLGTNYSRFQNQLNKKNIKLNRKMLADIAIREPDVFEAIVKEATSK